MVANKMVTWPPRVTGSLPRLLKRLFLVVCQRLWRCQVERLWLARSKHLSLELHLLVYDPLHHPHQNVDHNQLAALILPQLRQKNPLKSEIEALSVEKVLEGLHVVNRVRRVHYSGDVVQA